VTSRSLPRHQRQLTLADVLRHNVRHFGNKTSLTIDDHGLTYAELLALTDAVRGRIGTLVAPGDRVGLWMPNQLTWVAAFLAAIDLGVILVPINTRLTTSEVAVILQDAGVTLLLTVDIYRGRHYAQEALDSFHAATVPITMVVPDDRLEKDWRVHRRDAAGPREASTELDDAFCIQYTSGTTATPKGVVLTMRSYLQTARHVAHCQTASPSSHFMSAAPFFHCSGSMHAITVAMLAGCSLHSMAIWDPERFLDLVERHQADISHGIHFQDVIALGAAKARLKLRSLHVGYDISTPAQLGQLHDDFGIEGISNIYGMTETCGQFTMWHPDDPLVKRINGNGRTQPGNEVRVVDTTTGEPLPPGAEGEVEMRGPTITPGYFNRPEANAQAFTADGWFRSGDLGRISAEGELIFVARLKDIIRVGGENLAPAEVEQALRDLCDLKQVSVVGVSDARLGEVPAAVLVPNGAIALDALMAGLRTRLAGFKIPRQIYLADELPTTATNKVQRANVIRMIAEGKLQRVE
jgi:fatty-acyl-CoA synthase